MSTYAGAALQPTTAIVIVLAVLAGYAVLSAVSTWVRGGSDAYENPSSPPMERTGWAPGPTTLLAEGHAKQTPTQLPTYGWLNEETEEWIR